LSQLTQKALRDAAFFTEALAQRKFSIGTFCVNRAWLHPFSGLLPGGLAGEVLAWYKAVAIPTGPACGSSGKPMEAWFGTFRYFPNWSGMSMD